MLQQLDRLSGDPLKTIVLLIPTVDITGHTSFLSILKISALFSSFSLPVNEL